MAWFWQGIIAFVILFVVGWFFLRPGGWLSDD